MPRSNPKEDDISLFLVLFERQAKIMNIPAENQVAQLISLLPPDIVQLIAGEPEEDAKKYERAVFAMRMIGKGAKSLQKFSSYMALPAPVSQKPYDKINDEILLATTVVVNSCMKKAYEEEELLTGSSDIMVSGDGT
ncbi:hypothetical protein AVEN_86517-1 [Araneus ventricosus]|uniref:Uncharacterized protein n=1 Tax=Araneus ventricosus TaxID=182803 RepID=A0A4Y2N338_ARAVE|nr:hypothetical protein AVEN_86517-1 [Araneus ventricosus]